MHAAAASRSETPTGPGTRKATVPNAASIISTPLQKTMTFLVAKRVLR